MKRIIATLIAVALVAGMAHAQTTTTLKGYGFTGVRYSHAVVDKDAALGSIGWLTRVTGSLYNATYIDVGQYGKINNDWILLTPVQPGSSFYVGLLAGPDADFSAMPDGDIISYLTGSAGVMVAAQSKTMILGFNNPGLWLMAKYNIKFDNAMSYYNGWTAGAGLFLPW